MKNTFLNGDFMYYLVKWKGELTYETEYGKEVKQIESYSIIKTDEYMSEKELKEKVIEFFAQKDVHITITDIEVIKRSKEYPKGGGKNTK